MNLDFIELRRAFCEDADDHIETLEASLAKLGRGDDNETAFSDLFRTVHNLKGDAGAVGLEVIAELMHQCEETLEPVRKKTSELTPASIDIVGKVIEQLSELVEAEKNALATADAEPPIESLPPQTTSPTSSAKGVEFDADPETICDFINEATEHVDVAEEQLLIIENDASNAEALDSVYRTFHTIKGLASFLGLEDTRTLSHRAESMLNHAREQENGLTGQSFEVALECIDGLRRQIVNVQRWLNVGKLEVDPQLENLLNRIDAVLANEDCVSQDPIGLTASSGESNAIEPNTKTEGGAGGTATGPRGSSQPRESIKVDRERLDHLINVIGELVIGQAMLEEEIASRDTLGSSEVLSLDRLNKTVRDLQELSLSLRMVPVAPAFQKMARIVRDLARKLGKQVYFETSGEDTELDKSVVDLIGDPLMHMVRNAIDHGIESPEDRRTAGKPSHGTIALRAFHQGGNIFLELQDDGRGLNRDNILNKAVQRGIVGKRDKLSDNEVYELIFAPGFSTAGKVTDVSGRGVGMDVVRRNVETLQGSVSVQSEKESGTTITIRLPLTLAILDGLSVRVESETYILPILSVIESYSATADCVQSIAGKGEVVVVRGEVIPLVRLSHLLQSKQAVNQNQASSLLFVIVEERGRRYALLVDELLGQSQVVIKNLESNFRKVEGIAGATILGDGRVAMILDICGLLTLLKHGQQKARENSQHTLQYIEGEPPAAAESQLVHKENHEKPR